MSALRSAVLAEIKVLASEPGFCANEWLLSHWRANQNQSMADAITWLYDDLGILDIIPPSRCVQLAPSQRRVDSAQMEIWKFCFDRSAKSGSRTLSWLSLIHI